MFILDDIEKLITEHGSAAVLEQRMKLAREQFEAIERKLADTTLRADAAELGKSDLQSQLQAMTLKCAHAEMERQELQDRISNIGKADVPRVVDPGPSPHSGSRLFPVRHR